MKNPRTVVDLFSGAGGMSYGFHVHPAFRIIGAIDMEMGKPSSGIGSLECNKTYKKNIGITPLDKDIFLITKKELVDYLERINGSSETDILISCAPCTGFSRTIRSNLINDDPRNSLVVRSAKIAQWLNPSIFLMENVGELIEGRFNYHYLSMCHILEKNGYDVHGSVHYLNLFGLPQRRRRALVIAVKRNLKIRILDDLWEGYAVKKDATHVRRAISDLPSLEAGEIDPADPMHVSPRFSQQGMDRIKRIPPDGGSWPDLMKSPDGFKYLIPSMKRYVDRGKVGPHPDIYGRMAWDEPAVTIKRECSHTGNGRYAHPDQNRHCTVREMALLQGFPKDYVFEAGSLSNMYRHIGDAVPPLISYQLAWVCDWIFSGEIPSIANILLPLSHLNSDDIIKGEGIQLNLNTSNPI
ncbi:DNA cytosine methyltransferase [Acidobacteriota bacterium]